MDLDIKNLLTYEGVSSVCPLGCFITILQLRKDELVGKMTFFDFDVDIEKSDIKSLLQQEFSVNIMEAWLNIYHVLKNEFRDEDDVFELVQPSII
jgi:hypothetical protein